MPPLPGVAGPPVAPPGMPPLPGAGPPLAPLAAVPPAPAPAAGDFGMTLTMGDINAMTFFTCTSGGDMLGRSSAPRVSLSPEGCALIFSRMRRRLDAVGLSIADVLALFTSP